MCRREVVTATLCRVRSVARVRRKGGRLLLTAAVRTLPNSRRCRSRSRSLWSTSRRRTPRRARRPSRAPSSEACARRAASGRAAAPAAAVNVETQTDVEAAAAVADVEPADGAPPPTNAAGARRDGSRRRGAGDARRAAVSTLVSSARFTLTFYTTLRAYRSTAVIGSMAGIANTSGCPSGSSGAHVAARARRTRALAGASSMQRPALAREQGRRRRGAAARGRREPRRASRSEPRPPPAPRPRRDGHAARALRRSSHARFIETEHHHPVQRVWLECAASRPRSVTRPFAPHAPPLPVRPRPVGGVGHRSRRRRRRRCEQGAARGDAEALADQRSGAGRRAGGAEGDADGVAAAAACAPVPRAAGGKEGGGGELGLTTSTARRTHDVLHMLWRVLATGAQGGHARQGGHLPPQYSTRG